MKHTKRLLAAVMALAMVSAIAPMSAFAINQDDVKNGNGKATGSMTATYEVQAKYTVTIPAGVELKSDASVSKDITASDVLLKSGEKIKVTLASAQYVETGASEFIAKTEKGDSTATYTIGKGTATTGVKVGDVVAEFTNNPDETADPDVQTATLSFSEPTGATYAGTHTETLTFGISVEDATKTLTLSGRYFNGNNGTFVTKSLDIEYTENDTWKDIAGRYDEVSLVDNPYGPSEGKVVMLWHDEDQYIDGCQLKSEESTYNYKLVSINDKVSAYSSYFLQG